MTVVVTRNVAPRIRGFLASCMLEIGPGVYTIPNMNPSVRQRIWGVCSEWFEELHEDSSIVMTWADKSMPGGQGVLSLGYPPRVLLDHEGMILSNMKYQR
jgi:CRISPR-associated protein Cas2